MAFALSIQYTHLNGSSESANSLRLKWAHYLCIHAAHSPSQNTASLGSSISSSVSGIFIADGAKRLFWLFAHFIRRGMVHWPVSMADKINAGQL